MTQPFAMVPESVRLDKVLGLAHLAVYMALASFADAQGACYPGIDAIVESLVGRVSRRTVQSCLEVLAEREHIEVEKRRNGNRRATNLYRLSAFKNSQSECADSACANLACAGQRSLNVQSEALHSVLNYTSELDHKDSPASETDASVRVEKPQTEKIHKPRKTRKSPTLSPDLAAIRDKARDRFAAEYRRRIGADLVWTAKQNTALRNLVTARPAPGQLDSLMDAFFRAIDRKDAKQPYWAKDCEPTPARLLSILEAVETYAASLAPPPPAEQPRCPVCGKKIIQGAPICGTCKLLASDLKNPAAIATARAAYAAKEKP